MFPPPNQPEKIETFREPPKYPTKKQTSSIEEFVESNTNLEKNLNRAEDYSEEEEKSQIFQDKNYSRKQNRFLPWKLVNFDEVTKLDVSYRMKKTPLP